MEPVTNTALNQLFLAINHYVSTGDHIGEGIALPHSPSQNRPGLPLPTDVLQILMPCNTEDKLDISDFEKFKSRFLELQDTFKTKLEEGKPNGKFRLYFFLLRFGDCQALSQALMEKPGPLGWGSPKAIIDANT